MKNPKFCKDCRWSIKNPNPNSDALLCVHRKVIGTLPSALGSWGGAVQNCIRERAGGWYSPCGKSGRLFEYDRGQDWTTDATAVPAVTSVGAKKAVTSVGAREAASVGLTYWNAGCTDPDNCMLCKAARLPGSVLTNLWHAGIPSVKRDE